MPLINKKKNKKKTEYSKIICAVIMIYGILTGVLYYAAVFDDKMPDAQLATQSVITILGANLSYNFYQLGLKNSRNKYGINENGEPFKQKIGDDYQC